MNNIDAIQILSSYGVPQDEEQFREALDLAIKALEQTDKDKTFAFLDGAGQGILAGLNIRKGTWFVFMNGKKEIVRLPEADLVKLDANWGEINHAIEVLFEQEITKVKIVESEENK